MKKGGYVYLMSNVMNSVLYTGVTNDLKKRVYEHKHSFVDSFTKKYNVVKLVYYEIFDSIQSAISREKQIKGWIRKKKNDLVTAINPNWKDLYNNLD